MKIPVPFNSLSYYLYNLNKTIITTYAKDIISENKYFYMFKGIKLNKFINNNITTYFYQKQNKDTKILSNMLYTKYNNLNSESKFYEKIRIDCVDAYNAGKLFNMSYKGINTKNRNTFLGSDTITDIAMCCNEWIINFYQL